MDAMPANNGAVARKLVLTTALTLGAAAAAAVIVPATSSAHPARAVHRPAVHTTETYRSTVFANASGIKHATSKGRVAIQQPDDITALHGHIFAAFQNGVGPQGQANTAGNADSTIVEFSLAGKRIAQWDVTGKCDGLTADPLTGKVIATVNEDAHSSLYLITPRRGSKPAHYRYNEALPSMGGTDAIEIYHRMILISASAPGTTGMAAPQARYPAVYKVTLNAASKVAHVSGLFSDEAKAMPANSGTHGPVKLALTDPDSNEDVPAYAKRFGGDFMLTSQGDEEQIYVSRVGGAKQRLTVLKMTHSVDDSAWPAGPHGALYTTDNSNDRIYKITGRFPRGQEFAAETPCDQNGAPTTCPARGYPNNSLVTVNQTTGKLSKVALTGPRPAAQGMLYLR